MASFFNHGYALLIAVDENGDPNWALPSVGQDIELLSWVLTHPALCAYPIENVRVLSGRQATRAGILEGLEWLGERIQGDESERATALVYFAGHGWQDLSSPGNEYYLIPYIQEGKTIRSNALRARDFGATLAEIAPLRHFVLLDCCHPSETRTAGLRSAAIPPEELFGRGGGYYLSSSKGEQPSRLRRDGMFSLFAYHLAEALVGHAQPSHSEAEVLVSAVITFVTSKVQSSARHIWGVSQSPASLSLRSGDLPVALLLGGQGIKRGQLAPDPLDHFDEADEGAIVGLRIGSIIRGSVYQASGEVSSEITRGAETPKDDAAIIRKGVDLSRDVLEETPAETPAPSEERKPVKAARRVVSTGFSEPARPDRPVRKSAPLQTNSDYFFWLQIGAPVRGSIEEAETDIPQTPVGARLTVALFGFQDELVLRREADTGELEIQPDGSVRVTRQPLGDKAPPSRHREQRLFFPVRTPDKDGAYRLRCNIYWGQVLLQSRLVHARVETSPREMRGKQKSLRSVLDYTLSNQLNPAHLEQLAPHRLSILLNSNGDGTHSLYVYGLNDAKAKHAKEGIRFGEGELQGMINQARGTLRITSWNDPGEWDEKKFSYRYKDRQRDLPRLKEDLINLARWGYDFYDKVIDRFAGGMDAVSTFEELLLKPSVIQIAMKESPSYILPAALIYDYPLDTQATGHSLCPEFEEAFNHNQSLADTTCFQGQCASRGDLTTVCPSGFWGFRHSLGMPLSVQNAPDAPAIVPFQQQVELVMGAATDLQLLDQHAKVLEHLAPMLDWNYADTRQKVLGALKSGKPHLVYFYCHGGLLRNLPYLRVGPNDGKGQISPSNLRAFRIVWDTPRPLVFINGCHTTAVEPLQALNFIAPLVSFSRCAGVIGTEITIFEELASVFAEECLGRFIAGQTIGEALRNARLKLLLDGNPLGLVYIPFVLAGLRLVKTY